MRLELFRDCLGYLALNGKNIVDGSIVILSPLMRIRSRVDQLCINTDFLRCALHTAFKHMRDTELLAPDETVEQIIEQGWAVRDLNP